MYGKRGLLQFQYAIPWEHAREATIAVMHKVANSGLASFLAVLKAFGDIPSPGMMSFPRPGITLALDFPIKPGKSFPLFERLADMTREFGGRLYPAKDAAMTAPQFQAFYPGGSSSPATAIPPHLQLLGARHRRQTTVMSSPASTPSTTTVPVATFATQKPSTHLKKSSSSALPPA